MGAALRVKPGDELPLQFLLSAGPPAAPLFVRLTLERMDGTAIQSPIQMDYDAGRAVFSSDGILMPADEPHVIARYDVFTDSGWTTRSSSVGGDQDVFFPIPIELCGSVLVGVIDSNTIYGEVKC